MYLIHLPNIKILFDISFFKVSDTVTMNILLDLYCKLLAKSRHHYLPFKKSKEHTKLVMLLSTLTIPF